MPTPEVVGSPMLPASELDPVLAEALRHLDALVESFEHHPDPAVQERGLALLQAVDSVHRAGLARLASYLEEIGGPARERAVADPAVRVLLELYDLLPVGEPGPSVGFVPLADLKIVRAGARS